MEPNYNLKFIANKYNFTHYPSAKTLLITWMTLHNEFFKLKEKPKILIGKPFGFYSVFYYYYLINDISKCQLQSIFALLIDYDFNGVITEIQLEKILKLNYGKKLSEILNNILFIDPTLGSVYTVAQGLTKKSFVLIPDSYLHIGEFYEGLILNKLNKNNKITLFIDYNGSSKQNQICLNQKEIKKILNLFNQKAYIINTKELKNEN